MALGIAVFFVGIPLIKLIKAIVPQKKDPLRDAQVRLELAQKEAQAARINKETEKLYQKMYQEVLEDDSSFEEKGKTRIER